MCIIEFQPLGMSLSLKFTNASVKGIHFTFLLHEFTPHFSKHVISIIIKNGVDDALSRIEGRRCARLVEEQGADT